MIEGLFEGGDGVRKGVIMNVCSILCFHLLFYLFHKIKSFRYTVIWCQIYETLFNLFLLQNLTRFCFLSGIPICLFVRFTFRSINLFFLESKHSFSRDFPFVSDQKLTVLAPILQNCIFDQKRHFVSIVRIFSFCFIHIFSLQKWSNIIFTSLAKGHMTCICKIKTNWNIRERNHLEPPVIRVFGHISFSRD